MLALLMKINKNLIFAIPVVMGLSVLLLKKQEG